MRRSSRRRDLATSWCRSIRSRSIRFDGPIGRPRHRRRARCDARSSTATACRRRSGAPRDMTRILADTLREHGYLRRVDHAAGRIEHDSERAALVFAVDAGPRTTIGSVEWIGRADCRRSEFVAGLGVSPGAPYQREAINARIEKYVDERRRNGYYEAADGSSGAICRPTSGCRHHLDGHAGTRVRVVFTGDACRPIAAPTGAGAARRIGRRGSARGLEQPDRGIPERLRVPRRHGAAHARRERRRTRDHVHRDARPAVRVAHLRHLRQRVRAAGGIRVVRCVSATVSRSPKCRSKPTCRRSRTSTTAAVLRAPGEPARSRSSLRRRRRRRSPVAVRA